MGSPWGLLGGHGPSDGISSGIAAGRASCKVCLESFLTCFPLLAAVKPGQAYQKNDIVLEIHFPCLEMEPGVIFVPEPRSS